MVQRAAWFIGLSWGMVMGCGSGSVATTTPPAQPPPPAAVAEPAPAPPKAPPRRADPKPEVHITSCQQRDNLTTSAVGGLIGSAPGEMTGGFGYGRTGFGPGGGGTGWGTIGTGRYGTIGPGPRPWASVARVDGKSLRVRGALDRAIVRRYVRRWQPAMNRCYATLFGPKHRGKRPSGTMFLAFNIDGQGVIKGPRARRMPNALTRCVTQYIGRARLPKPKGSWVTVSVKIKFSAPSGRGGYGGYGRYGRRKIIPTARLGQASIAGSLDRQVIRRLLRRRIARMRYCYEKRLLIKPALQGRVVARFTIEATGSVSKVRATGFDPQVARCIESVLQSTRFPRPPGGGVVKVSYPLVFRNGTGSPLPVTPTTPPPARPEPPRTAPRTESPVITKLPWRACRAVHPHSAMVGKRAAIQSCYAAALAKDQSLSGVLRVQYASDKTGKTISKVMVSGVDNAALVACVNNAVKGTSLAPGASRPNPHEAVCTVSLANETAPAQRPQRIDITESEVRVGSNAIVPTRRLTLGDFTKPVVNELAAGFERARVAASAPVVLHVAPRVDAKALDLVLHALAKRGMTQVSLALLSPTGAPTTQRLRLSAPNATCRASAGRGRVALGRSGLTAGSTLAVSKHTSQNALAQPGGLESAIRELGKEQRQHVAVSVYHGATFLRVSQLLAAVRGLAIREISYVPSPLR